MRLNVDFSALKAAVNQMGASPVNFHVDGGQAGSLEPIDLGLQRGIEVPLHEVDRQNGVLSYKGRQVLLYIQDHGGRVQQALQDGSLGRRFHVADCSKLKEMRARGRFERYVATNELTGEFFVDGRDAATGEYVEGKTKLRVCQFCLGFLNYKRCNSGRRAEVAREFDLEAFFLASSTFFNHHPSRYAGRGNGSGYSDNWETVSREYRESVNFCCEACRVDLSCNRRLLHAHHINGVKSDNQQSNLKALCAICHGKQPSHGHLTVSRADKRIIMHLRREQRLLGERTWSRAVELTDASLEGLLYSCEGVGISVPAVGYELAGDGEAGNVILDICWPEQRVAVATDDDGETAARAAGWRVWKIGDVLRDPAMLSEAIG